MQKSDLEGRKIIQKQSFSSIPTRGGVVTGLHVGCVLFAPGGKIKFGAKGQPGREAFC